MSQLLSEEVDKVSALSHAPVVFSTQRRSSAPPLIRHFLSVAQAEHELRVAQTEFDRQAEVTRLLLEGISSTHVSGK